MLARPVTAKVVEVALARVVLPVTFNVPVAVRLAPVRFPEKYPLPATSRAFVGVDVPIPTLPLDKTVNNEAFDDEAMVNGLVPAVPLMPRVANDVEEPTANVPNIVFVPAVDVALIVPNVPVVAARMVPVVSVVVADEFEK